MIYRVLLAIIGILCGGWMLFDGIHVMLRGKYFGPEKPGPWSILFSRMGINPFALGPLFVVFGVVWIVSLVAMLRGHVWGWWGAVTIAAATLWYLPVGTLLSVIFLILAFVAKSELLR